MKSRYGGSCLISQHSLRLEVYCEFEAILDLVPDSLNYRKPCLKKQPPIPKKYFSFEEKCIITDAGKIRYS